VGTPIPYPGGRQLDQNSYPAVAQSGAIRREPASGPARNSPWTSQYRYTPADISRAASHGERSARRAHRLTDSYDSVMTFMGRQGGRAINEMRNEMTSDSEDEPLIDLSDESRGRDPGLDYWDTLRNIPPMRSPRSSAYWEATRGGHLGPSLRTLSPSPAAYPRTSSVGGTGIAPESWMFGPRIRGSTANQSSFGAFGSARRRVGDYMLDSEIDNSYEGLLRLGERIGLARPPHTPASIINSLPRGVFNEFPNPGSETRCPICLDDYLPEARVLAAHPCNHFFHSECLEQWLQTSRSCPNCRTMIRSPNSPPTATAGPQETRTRIVIEGLERSGVLVRPPSHAVLAEGVQGGITPSSEIRTTGGQNRRNEARNS